MKATWIIAVLLLHGVGTPMRADTVELGGFACLFGENLALLNLYQPAQAAPIAFTLSEGQAQYGIKLLQVDATNHQVQIEQEGVKKYLRLCAAPDLSAAIISQPVADGEKLTSEQKQAILTQINNSEASQRILAGNPDLSFISAGGAGTKTGQNSNAGAGSTDATGTASGQQSLPSNGSTPSAGSSDVTSQYWYQQALIFEQERIETAGDVLDGDSMAWPRTPLTPAGTPDQLIGKEAYFFNRYNTPAGYTPPDSVNPLNAVGN